MWKDSERKPSSVSGTGKSFFSEEVITKLRFKRWKEKKERRNSGRRNTKMYEGDNMVE